jgi:hypothetical protein
LLDAEPADIEAESLPPEAMEEESPAGTHAFLTAEESSVFAEERGVREPRIHGESNVFAEEDEVSDDDDLAEPNE